MMTSTAAQVTVDAADGVRVAVHLLDGRRDADAPSLVLVHAAGFHGAVWAPLAARLAGRFRCVAPDLRGHGDSAAPPGPDFDWRGFGHDVLAVVDGLGLARPFGFGHSSGGTALLLAEQQRPGTFAALYCYEPIVVPADPPLGRDPDNWLAAGARRRRAVFSSRDEARAHYRSRPPFDAMDPAVLDAYVEHGLEAAPGGGVRLKCRPEHEALVYEMATAHDCFGRLPDVSCAVTLARGGRSEAAAGSDLARLRRRIPRARVETHEDLGHLGPLDAPTVVAGAISDAFG